LISKGIYLNAYNEYARPYTATDSEPSLCTNAKNDDAKYRVGIKDVFRIVDQVQTPGDEINVRNVENMKQHIYFEGPVMVGFVCYREFINYDGKTIYEPSKEALQEENPGMHAVELIGWGKDQTSGVEYWVGRNSWGPWPKTHDKCAGTGTFYFRLGNNTCGIETWCVGATPIIENVNKAPKDAGGLYPGQAPCTENKWKNSTIKKSEVGTSKLMVGGALIIVVFAIGYVLYTRNKENK
jgi:hypothetical protein